MTFVLLICLSLNSMDIESQLTQHKPVHVYTIRGMNGTGSELWYVQQSLGINKANITQTAIPKNFPDLGQSRCQKFFAQEFSNNSHENVIVHTASQGTATAINYLAANNDSRVKALILEAPLVSGNSAISHTIGGPLVNLPAITKLPFSYYWLPYLVKLVFPLYNPAGQQAIRSIDKISTNLPIIIIHDKQDPQLSYNDACALYYRLRANGNINAHFISTNQGDHMNLAYYNSDTQYCIREILKKNNLNTSIRSERSAINSQPEFTQYKSHYDKLIRKENNHRLINYGLKMGALGLLAYALYKRADTIKQLLPH